jgi:AcrR family transcriptional regulator
MIARAETARETRDRILGATMELHAARGVIAVSHKDIAERADVSVGTVYHHFPTRGELVQACGARSADELAPPEDAIDPKAPTEARIAALCDALVALSLRAPWIEKIRTECIAEPAIAMGLEAWQKPLDALIRRALGPRLVRRRNAVTVVAAITDVSVVNRLAERGMSPREIATALGAIVLCWLEGGHS